MHIDLCRQHIHQHLGKGKSTHSGKLHVLIYSTITTTAIRIQLITSPTVASIRSNSVLAILRALVNIQCTFVNIYKKQSQKLIKATLAACYSKLTITSPSVDVQSIAYIAAAYVRSISVHTKLCTLIQAFYTLINI